MSSNVRVVVDGDYHAGVERITTAEAARRLGVSRTQLRRMLDAGQLRYEREPRPQGSRLIVLWDAPNNAPPDKPVRPTITGPDAPRRTVPVEEFEWLKARLERAEEERAELRRMLQTAQQTIAAQLEPARTSAPTSDEPPRENGTSPTDHAATTDVRRRSWFGRLLGRV